jgi:hypothetical protein
MNAPTVRAILEALAAAGDEGMLARTMTLQFSYPEDVSRRTIRVRSALRDLERVGRARRSGTTEPTPYHTHAPVYRWFITPDGRRYLENGCRPDSLVAMDTRRQEAEAARQHRAQIVAEARLAGYGPETRDPSAWPRQKSCTRPVARWPASHPCSASAPNGCGRSSA